MGTHQEPSEKLPIPSHKNCEPPVPRHRAGKALSVRTEAWTPPPPLILPEVRRADRDIWGTHEGGESTLLVGRKGEKAMECGTPFMAEGNPAEDRATPFG